MCMRIYEKTERVRAKPCEIMPEKLSRLRKNWRRWFNMDYRKEIIEMIEKCTNNHWIEVIYLFVDRLLK